MVIDLRISLPLNSDRVPPRPHIAHASSRTCTGAAEAPMRKKAERTVKKAVERILMSLVCVERY